MSATGDAGETGELRQRIARYIHAEIVTPLAEGLTQSGVAPEWSELSESSKDEFRRAADGILALAIPEREAPDAWLVEWTNQVGSPCEAAFEYEPKAEEWFADVRRRDPAATMVPLFRAIPAPATEGLRMARARALLRVVVPLAADEIWHGEDVELREIWAVAADEYEQSRAALNASEPAATRKVHPAPVEGTISRDEARAAVMAVRAKSAAQPAPAPLSVPTPEVLRRFGSWFDTSIEGQKIELRMTFESTLYGHYRATGDYSIGGIFRMLADALAEAAPRAGGETHE